MKPMPLFKSIRGGSNLGINIFLALTISVSIIFWISTIDQPLVDRHDFRQAQTAITQHIS